MIERANSKFGTNTEIINAKPTPAKNVKFKINKVIKNLQACSLFSPLKMLF